MVTISPFQSYTAALFADVSGAQAQPLGLPTAAVSVPSTSRPADPLRLVVTQGDAADADVEPQWVKDGRAELAKAEAAMAVWEAGEQQFEQENGFRRKVNSMALGAHAKAQSGHFGVPSFQTTDEAADYLEYLVSGMRSNVGNIGSSTLQAGSLARPEVAAAYGDVRTGQLLAMHADQRKAAEMDLFILSAALNKAFGTSGPVTRQDGGTVSFVAQDFSFQGRAFARLSEQGIVIRLDQRP